MNKIITEPVEMPPKTLRKYQMFGLDFSGKKWVIKDGLEEIYRGNYEESTLVCYNLNKKYYRDEIHK